MNVARSGLYLGVDGGQTSTTALVGDSSGQILGCGVGGPSNHVKAAHGRARLISAVSDAVGVACKQIGATIDSVEFEGCCLGFTGGIADKEEVLREILRCRHMVVTDDVTIALAGAHDNGVGVVTIAGTGSVAMARNASGEVATAGGWGFAFGDEGAAWGIVREALRAAFRAKEGWGPATILHDLFLEESGDTDIHVFRRRLYTEEYPRPRIAAFSKLVTDAAEQGDTVAREILQSGAAALANLANVVRGRVFPPTEAVDVAYVGGVFGSPIVLGEFQHLMERDDHVRVISPKHDPATGALFEAIRLARTK
jgi:N-acetylglucosamine kinase-like BadF-type ATPase